MKAQHTASSLKLDPMDCIYRETAFHLEEYTFFASAPGNILQDRSHAKLQNNSQ